MSRSVKSARKLRALVVVLAGGSTAFTGMCLYSGNEKFYRNVSMPLIHRMTDAESAHSLAISLAKRGLVPKCSKEDSPVMNTKALGFNFSNPIGLAAGFDKNAEAIPGLFRCGFGFIEVGTITPEAQLGNPCPRIFRLNDDNGVINRCGFNSKGHEYAHSQLKQALKNGQIAGVIGISLGKNKNSNNAVEDYVRGVTLLGPLADFLVINISSPNTPGLRQLQEKKNIENILKKVLEARDSLKTHRPPVLVKISPDISPEGKKDIADVVTRKGCRVDGLIVCNTTTQRPDSLQDNQKNEEGGLSGAPLKKLSTDTIRDMHKLTKGSVPIVGVGGVFSGADAYEKIRAGASLIQVYSVLTFEGPPAIGKIKRELEELLQADGFSTVSEAVGIDNKS